MLLSHWLESEEDDFDMVAIGREVRHRAEALRYHNMSITVTNCNGTDTVLITAGANRWRGDHDELIDFVRSIPELAPGSYGLIHFEDDEAIPQGLNDACQVYVLKRGVLTIEVEPRFTPLSVEVGS